MQKILYSMLFLFATACTGGDVLPNHIAANLSFVNTGHLSAAPEIITVKYYFDTVYEDVDYTLDDLSSLVHYTDPDGQIVPLYISDTHSNEDGCLYIDFTYNSVNVKDGWYTLSIDQDPKYNVSPYEIWHMPLPLCNMTGIGKSVDANQFMRVSLVDRTAIYAITFGINEKRELIEIGVGFSQNIAENFYLDQEDIDKLAFVQVDGQFVEGHISFGGRLTKPPPHSGFAWVSDEEPLLAHDDITLYINQSIVSHEGKKYEFLVGLGEEIDGVLYRRIVLPVSSYFNCDLHALSPVVYGDEISMLNGGE